ncbi:MAG: DNA-binding protein, partial [Candidatus Thorarchaeota archaeon]
EAILRQILTPEARSRLTNIKMVKPQFAEQIEMQLIQLASSGKLKGVVTDEQLKGLLQQLQGKERERKVTFR